MLKSNKKKKRIEMSDCEGVRSYITGHLQLQRCVIVKWSVKAAKGWTLLGVMGAVGLAGIDGSLGDSGRRKACGCAPETVVAST